MTQQLLLKYLRYEPEQGKFYWIKKTSPQSRITLGEEAGFVCGKGYIEIGLFGSQYKVHHLVWLAHHGVMPSKNIDHEDQVRTNNVITNLRLANHDENSKNMKKYHTNKSGHTGVCWNKRQSKWHSQISVNHKRIHLGFFDELDDAIAARKAANTKHGFHKNHGN